MKQLRNGCFKSPRSRLIRQLRWPRPLKLLTEMQQKYMGMEPFRTVFINCPKAIIITNPNSRQFILPVSHVAKQIMHARTVSTDRRLAKSAPRLDIYRLYADLRRKMLSLIGSTTLNQSHDKNQCTNLRLMISSLSNFTP